MPTRFTRYVTNAWRFDGGLVQQFADFGRAQAPDLVCAVLNTPTMYRIAEPLAQELGVPLTTIVWDPPSGIGLHFSLDRFSRARARGQFEAAVRASQRCGVISENMGDEYQRDFGVDTVVLRHGIQDGGQLLNSDVAYGDEIRIGFCGSMYAEREWESLLAALDVLDWEIDSVPVRIRFMGKRMPTVTANRPARLEFLGWRPMEEAVRLMAECHMKLFAVLV